MLILFISELNNYFYIEESSEMYIDNQSLQGKSDKIRINLDIEFYRFPCEVFSIDAEDIMGNEEINIIG